MPNITIDGQQYQVEEEQNLLSACLSLGLDLPYFCWHPAMGSVGACRQCAVIEYANPDDWHGRLVMSCMTPVKDGGHYSLQAETAREFRGGIIEDLMTNHPHDCPVCEEGGECHLQDMTEMTGHTSRRYRGQKRTHRNQYLGPFINHEMNRCIACYRCTRFYRDYAGGDDLEALGRNNQVYFGRQQDGMLENSFSGNLVEVCPTGVFTDKTFSAHFVRKWDLQTAASICEHCAVGCNTAPGAREGWDGKDQVLRRVVNLFHKEINGYFLCDRGRFGYDYVNSKSRLKQVLSARTDQLIDSTAALEDKIHSEISPADAVQKLAQSIAQTQKGQRRLLGIGSPRTSLENNFALRRLVGEENFYAGLSAADLQLLHRIDALQRDPRIHSPTTPEIEAADAVLILAEDIANTAPRIALAVRQAARNRQKQQAQKLRIPLWQDASVRQLDGKPTPIFIAALESGGLEDIAEDLLHAPPQDIARFTEAVAQLIGDGSTSIDLPELQLQQAQQIADTLCAAEKPLIISGSGGRSDAVLEAVGQLAIALATKSQKACNLYLACAESNSLGLAQLCRDTSKNLNTLCEALQSNTNPANPLSLLLLENDLYRQVNSETASKLFSAADEVIQFDCLHNHSSRRADLIFPAAATAESQGTLINSNGFAQRFYAVYEGAGFIQESWRWLVDAANACGENGPAIVALGAWQHCGDISDAIAQEFTELRVIGNLGPDEDFRIDGMKIARQSHRYSGRTAIHADKAVAESKPHTDPDAPMTFSMEGLQNPGRSPLQANIWSPGWNSNQALHKFQQQVGGIRRGGSSGKMLERAALTYNSTPREPSIPQAFNLEPGRYLLLPVYRLFGSGELSAAAPAIASVIAEPFAILNPQDAQQLGVEEKAILQLTVAHCRYLVEVRISPSITVGTLGVPLGFPALDGITSARHAQLQRIEGEIVRENGGDQ